MKHKILGLVLGLVFGLSAAQAQRLSQAPEMNYTIGAFELRPLGSEPNNYCDSFTYLTMDRAEVLGPVAFLSEALRGICEIYVPADQRYYDLNTVERDGCGSLKYSGTREALDGRYQLEIVDHRKRLCFDIQQGLIEVRETSPSGEVRELYSQENLLAPAE